jgi:hypothetical protein
MPQPQPRAAGWFRSEESFTDPNAICPVCGDTVFYYQNSSGSRVYFDDLGWPWPKHPCTDNPGSQTGKVQRPSKEQKRRVPPKANKVTLYELVECSDDNGEFFAKFRNINSTLMTITVRLPLDELDRQEWDARDFRDAPSFIIRRHPAKIVIEFISVRKSAIGVLIVPRTPK